MALKAYNTGLAPSLADIKAIAKAVETFLIFSLQLHRNSYLYLNISVDNGSNSTEASRENVRQKLSRRKI